MLPCSVSIETLLFNPLIRRNDSKISLTPPMINNNRDLASTEVVIITDRAVNGQREQETANKWQKAFIPIHRLIWCEWFRRFSPADGRKRFEALVPDAFD